MDLSPLINKTVDCRFSGASVSLALSHGLFSSYDIDSGTRLLLKALAEHAELANARNLADVGCGTGVIGIAAATAFSGLSVTSIDRDALALAFTEMNARANGLSDRLKARAGLLLDFPADERYDRIVSNLPAKAGKEALADFLLRAPGFCSPTGSVWIVIVNTLATFAESQIVMAGHEMIAREAGKEHTVVGFRAGPARGAKPDTEDARILAPYLRGTFGFALGEVEYDLECARDIPDFDTLSFGLQLCAKFLSSRHCAGLGEEAKDGLLVWNPGQGHVPVYCARTMDARKIILAGRDWLELLVSSENLKRLHPGCEVSILHVADPSCLGEEGVRAGLNGVRAILAFPDIVPGYAWAPGLFDAALGLLATGESLVVEAPSAALSCLDRKKPAGFSPAGDRREKANRAARFVKR
jgi:predicted nicotinamide N-methyase